jgi:pyruvate, orthophosphate dikinase
MEQLQAPVFARDQDFDVIGEGTPASPGAASGAAVFDSARAQELNDEGKDVVLVRPETSPEDIAGMIAARGIVTAVGGRTSHAAVVARGIGRAAVCGVAGLEVDPAGRRAMFRDRVIQEGDAIALDGATGVVAAGSVRLVPAQPAPRVALVLAWADDRRVVPIELGVPAQYVRVSSVEEVESAESGAPLLVDVDWEGSQSGPLLDRVVIAAVERGCGDLALQLPDTLVDGDMRPPAAPWTLLVGSPDAWPARLLAARLRVSSEA